MRLALKIAAPVFTVLLHAEFLSCDGEETHAPLHVSLSSCIYGAVIGEEKFVDGGCGHTQLKVHPPVVEEVAVRPAGDADSAAFVKVHDLGFLEILREFSLTPHLQKERRQIINDLGTIVLEDPSRDRVRSGRFCGGELLHSPGRCVERGQEDEVDVGLRLRQTGGAGVGDGDDTGDTEPMTKTRINDISSIVRHLRSFS
ncbi:hypothetical protein SprV_0301214900 [Sparganum proliferum]